MLQQQKQHSEQYEEKTKVEYIVVPIRVFVYEQVPVPTLAWHEEGDPSWAELGGQQTWPQEELAHCQLRIDQIEEVLAALQCKEKGFSVGSCGELAAPEETEGICRLVRGFGRPRR